MRAVEVVLALVVLATVVAASARRFRVPAPSLLVLAGLLNRKLRAKTLLRMGILIPYVTSVAASTLVFGTVFSRDTGLANYALHFIGIGPIDWQAGRFSSWASMRRGRGMQSCTT